MIPQHSPCSYYTAMGNLVVLFILSIAGTRYP
jgi:hypothetical protein